MIENLQASSTSISICLLRDYYGPRAAIHFKFLTQFGKWPRFAVEGLEKIMDKASKQLAKVGRYSRRKATEMH
ncbi:hypothetical protein NC652_034974 [Populus alba x Populus x berolinensis]|nr:hypothetical protein NC652_034974 [Populus alba x Populus x berolinensis]